MEYAKFKCQECPELLHSAEIIVNHQTKKVSVIYNTKEKGSIVTKIDEIIDYYKTFIDPYVPFSEYGLGIREKER